MPHYSKSTWSLGAVSLDTILNRFRHTKTAMADGMSATAVQVFVLALLQRGREALERRFLARRAIRVNDAFGRRPIDFA